VDEMREIILFEMDFKSFHDLKIMNFIEKMGFDDGERVRLSIQKYSMAKNIPEDITFEELYSKTGVLLTVTVTNITNNCAEYHNAIHTPKMSVFLSLRMTMCVPFLFMPIEWNGCYYCDGALIDPYPYDYSKIHSIPQKHRIGVWLINTNDYFYLMNKAYQYTFKEPMEYILSILLIVYTQMLKNKYKKIQKNTIAIDFECSCLNIEMSDKEKADMYMKGLLGCRKFMKKKMRLIQRRRLCQKYFNLWKFLSYSNI
jgi:predicted patatin/cPLA2 family phospholipase